MAKNTGRGSRASRDPRNRGGGDYWGPSDYEIGQQQRAEARWALAKYALTTAVFLGIAIWALAELITGA